ncbi:hypothetical protein HC776_00310 [bacterium]|nr:hypothetical protein [bacterium]
MSVDGLLLIDYLDVAPLPAGQVLIQAYFQPLPAADQLPPPTCKHGAGR